MTEFLITAAERDEARVRDARLHELLTGQAVEWRRCLPSVTGQPWLVLPADDAGKWRHVVVEPCALAEAGGWQVVPRYSNPDDWNGIRALVDAMRAKGWALTLEIRESGSGDATWEKGAFGAGIKGAYAGAGIAPEAVCRAALSALEPPSPPQVYTVNGESTTSRSEAIRLSGEQA